MEHDILNVLLYLWGLLALSVVTINWLYEAYQRLRFYDQNDRVKIIDPQISTVCEPLLSTSKKNETNSFPVSRMHKDDFDGLAWLNELLCWWYRENTVQVDKWIDTWITSLNDYLGRRVIEDSQIEALQFVSSKLHQLKIVSVTCSKAMNNVLDDSLLSLTVRFVLDNVQFQIRVSNSHCFNVTLEHVEGKLIFVIQRDLTTVKFNVQFEECPHIDRVDVKPTSEQFAAMLNLQLIDALTNTKTFLLLDFSTKSSSSSASHMVPLECTVDCSKKRGLVDDTVAVCNSNSYGYSISEAVTCAQNDKVSRRPLRISTSFKSSVVKPYILTNSRNLMVKIVKASGLKPDIVSERKNASSRRGTFVVVKVDDPFQQRSTGAAAPGGNQPFWDQHFFFELNERSKKLTLEVFDRQGLSCNLFLGTVSVELENITFMSSRLIQPLRNYNDTEEGVDGLLTFELLFMEANESLKRLPSIELDEKEKENCAISLSTSFDQKELENFMKSPLKAGAEEEVKVNVHNTMSGDGDLMEISSTTAFASETNNNTKCLESRQAEFIAQESVIVKEPLTVSSSIQHLESLQKRKTFGTFVKRWRGLFLSLARRGYSAKNKSKNRSNGSTMSDGFLANTQSHQECNSREDPVLRKKKKIRFVIPRFLRKHNREKHDTSDLDYASTLQSIKGTSAISGRSRVVCPLVFYSTDNKKISLSSQQIFNIEQQLQQPQLYQKYLQNSLTHNEKKV